MSSSQATASFVVEHIMKVTPHSCLSSMGYISDWWVRCSSSFVSAFYPLSQEFFLKTQIGGMGCAVSLGTPALWNGTTGLKECFEDLLLKRVSDDSMGFFFCRLYGRKKNTFMIKNYLFLFDFFHKYVWNLKYVSKRKNDPCSMEFYEGKNQLERKRDLSIVSVSLCGETIFDVADSLVI